MQCMHVPSRLHQQRVREAMLTGDDVRMWESGSLGSETVENVCCRYAELPADALQYDNTASASVS
jgi:hypothetical protein